MSNRSIAFTYGNCSKVREYVGRPNTMGCVQPIVLDEDGDWVVLENGQRVVEVAPDKWRVEGKTDKQIAFKKEQVLGELSE